MHDRYGTMRLIEPFAPLLIFIIFCKRCQKSIMSIDVMLAYYAFLETSYGDALGSIQADQRNRCQS